MTMDPRESSAQAEPDPQAIYARLGAEAFWEIARRFYGRLARDELLRPMFPADLEEPIRNQAEFLIQYFGGPQTYSLRKGHPRLRMRHHSFSIGLAERNAWVAAMDGALADAAIPEPDRSVMRRYFANTATFLMNREE